MPKKPHDLRAKSLSRDECMAISDALFVLSARSLLGSRFNCALRAHHPEVSRLWSDAPASAGWIDWRVKLGPTYAAILDEVLRDLFSQKES
jgi:hypothetical protein